MKLLTKVKFQVDYKDSLLPNIDVVIFLPFKLQKGDFIDIEYFVNEASDFDMDGIYCGFWQDILIEMENEPWKVDSVFISKYDGMICQRVYLKNS